MASRALTEAELKEHLDQEKHVLDYQSDKEWKKESPSEGVEWYSRSLKTPSGTELTATLAVLDINHPAEAVYVALLDPTLRLMWDTENIKEMSVLEVLNPVTHIAYRVSNSFPWPMDQRDTVQRTHEKREADGTLMITWVDTTHSSKPPTDKYIRMKTYWGALLLKPLSGGSKCHAVMCNGIDVLGSVPASLVSMSAYKIPILLAQAQTFLNKKENLDKALALAEKKAAERVAAGLPK